MHDWLARITDALAAGRTAVCVTCVEVLGSAPCAPGSRLIVDKNGSIGTVGGGNLEYRAIEQAEKLIASDSRCLDQVLPLGPLLAQCCGGRVRLVYEKFVPEDFEFFEAARLSDGAIVTRCVPSSYRKWVVVGDGERVLSLTAAMPEGRLPNEYGFDGTYWHEPLGKPPPLVCLFGGGHVGTALAHILETLPCEVVIVDPRDDVAAKLRGRFQVMQTDDPTDMNRWWRSGALAVVLTHSHELDFAWVSAILHRGDSAYCGLIGSRTKRVRFVRRLKAQGLSDLQIAHLTSPIGLPGLNSKEPGAVAVSTAAELLPFLAGLSHARAGQNCDCVLPGNPLVSENA